MHIILRPAKPFTISILNKRVVLALKIDNDINFKVGNFNS